MLQMQQSGDNRCAHSSEEELGCGSHGGNHTPHSAPCSRARIKVVVSAVFTLVPTVPELHVRTILDAPISRGGVGVHVLDVLAFKALLWGAHRALGGWDWCHVGLLWHGVRDVRVRVWVLGVIA